ncbi:MAG: class I SAM-dependent methyltransferase [Actinomycetes bacterium]
MSDGYGSDQQSRERDLVAYYDAEVADRAHRGLAPQREAARTAFVDLLVSEGRHHLLEVGCGPGRDGQAFVDAGLGYVGVDLSPASVAHCRRDGLDCRVASALELPFGDGEFEAAWTMSTLLHLPNAAVGRALGELVRVVAPGAPIGVGVWGGEDVEGVDPSMSDAAFGPARFFSLRSSQTWRRLLAEHADVERWEPWVDARGVTYQFAVLRTG